jgi:hypothetical protein
LAWRADTKIPYQPILQTYYVVVYVSVRLILHLHLELICGVINQQYTYASGQGARWMQSYGKATRQTPRHRPRNEASITQRYAWHWHASTTLPSGESGQMHGSILVRVTGHKQYPDDAP